MIVIDKVILHIMEPERNNLILSDAGIEEVELEVEKMLHSKMNKGFQSTSKKACFFKENSAVKTLIEQYKNEELGFEELSRKIAVLIFDTKMKYGQYASSDLIISEVVYDSRRYLFVLDNGFHEGITHNVAQSEDQLCSTLLSYKTLVSNNFVSADKAFFIELSDLSVYTVEKKVEIEANKVNFYAQLVLGCTAAPSYKETFTSLQQVSEEMVEKFELNEVEIIPKMKQIVKENVESNTPVSVEEIATMLFPEKEHIKSTFEEELRKKGIEKEIAVEYTKQTKAEKVQKIKTDKGIEISIPVDYMNTKDYVEFINNPDGTISIQLKNIIHITSK